MTGTYRVNEKTFSDIEYLLKKGIAHSYTAYSAIKDVCKKKKKTAYGFHWEYVQE